MKANKEACQTRTGQTIAEVGVTGRQAKAITRGGLEAAEDIRTRALKQRNAGRAEAAEAKS